MRDPVTRQRGAAAHLAYDEPPKATLLVNQPVVKKGVKRISAPFTVESHSPWVYLSPSAPETDDRPSGKPTDIDCWMLDTNYDGKSFFARRIHFPGKSADRQIKRLKTALGRRVDPAQWEHMESLTSAPFRRPDGGRVAVRIVTTFGDEMLCVLEVAT